MRVFYPIVFSILLCFSQANAAHTMFNQSVLVIHSYHKTMQWVEEVQQGIEENLLGSLGDSVDIQVEYVDSKRFGGSEYLSLLAGIWRYKYLKRRPDCLIVCDDNALNLVLELRDEIFTGIPIVFCGVNHYDPKRFIKFKNITGVVEAYDLAGTLEIIKKLLPKYRRLFIINDDTTTGRANKLRLEAIQYDYGRDFSFMYSGRLNVAALKESVAHLSDDTAILLMSFNRDADGRVLRYRDAASAIYENSRRPIFGVWSFYLGRGIVGGSLVDGVQQGENAAALCLKILQGARADDLPVVMVSPNRAMFDYRELKRFSIPLSRLPEGAVVINKPESLWHAYKTAILISIGLFVVQSLIIFLLIQNVRKRKMSEELLQKSTQNLAITLAAIDDAVFSVDPRLGVVQANRAAVNLLGSRLQDVAGEPLDALLEKLDPVGGQQIATVARESLASGNRCQLPVDLSLKPFGGSEKKLVGTCTPIRGSADVIIGSVLIMHDITERESMQTMLAQSRKMEAIGQLAGGVAHDFNNLLTVISGFAELLSLQLKDGENEKERENVLKILHAAGRAKDLTRQLLSFARKGKIISSVVDCHQVLRSTCGLLERSIDKKITIKSDLQAVSSNIIGDPVQLENIFLNIGINGSDAMEDAGGSLCFRSSNVVIKDPMTCEFGEVLDIGEYLCVSISDTGHGISEETRQVIFEPFFTTKAQRKGTGLGLSAVFGAMKEHNGRIRIQSELGHGTDFQLYFPVSKIAVSVPPHREKTLRKGGETILLIDDEELVLASGQGLLQELGYTVLVGQSAREGLEIYRASKDQIDLVLLDMIMPDMDGVQCFSLLKEIDAEVRVIICSGFAKNSRVREVEKLGARGFLQKPYTGAELTEILTSVFAATKTEMERKN